ncbi:NFX1-type zinc finger-containing protein 1 [Desmophyllum pertusum]|uniref:NFX1-type zinc finger-containing protein 1 n=1 Tax=Desmophyllum pertusum TaxID=174260 RepID=A0A9W9ZPF3_9CNID|nr:NFX1-type zinc finger-containing protein 1 [Desmophyllum pertusum]
MVISYDTGKNQSQRSGKVNPANRNIKSATQHKTQPPACRPHKDVEKKSFPRQSNVLDLKTLKEKDCTEVVYKLNGSMNRFNDFLKSEEEQHNSDDFIFDLTCTLAIVCDAPPNEKTNKILAALKGSAFFSSKIPYLLDRVQAATAINDPESQRRLIEWLIKVFKRYLKHLPSSYADPPYDQLKQTLDQSNIDRKDELKKQLDDFKQVRDDIIKAEREKHGRRYTNKTGQKPPNDFRDIPIRPTDKEIKSHERPFLRKNIKKGRYQDVEHYLDVQFRLLREDFLEPLREGIYEITHHIPRGQRNQLMKCYQGVRIHGKEFTLSGINYKVQFDVSKFGMTKWAHSKRLIFGSFLCLSKDNFETILFATVANRDPKDLQKGRFDIRFLEEQNIFDIEKRQQEYQMVESPAYFEAYRHVLKGLKGLDKDSLPFTKYLVECSAEVEPPEYLRREDDQDPVCYDLSKALDVPFAAKATRVPVLKSEAWPLVETLRLNRSQLEALRTAITTEFSVIQGPPGTGKTYVGAKIVRCWLENRTQWDPHKISPMLMVCYTNHALDQFLEKVLEFLPKREIIRVGGRCKSEQLEDCNLKLFTKRYRRYNHRFSIQDKMKKNEGEIKACKAVLAKADNELLLEFKHLEGYMNIQHTDQLYEAVFPPNAAAECRASPNTFKLWLCNNKQMNHLNQRTKVSKKSETDESQDGSILLQDGAVDEVDDRYLDPVPAFGLSTTSGHFEDDEVGSDEQSTKTVPKRMQQKELKQEIRTRCPSERDAPVAAATEHLMEQSQLSDFVIERDLETDELTIAVEDEAMRIQNERCIEGDEEYTLVVSQQLHEEEKSRRI